MRGDFIYIYIYIYKCVCVCMCVCVRVCIHMRPASCWKWNRKAKFKSWRNLFVVHVVLMLCLNIGQIGLFRLGASSSMKERKTEE